MIGSETPCIDRFTNTMHRQIQKHLCIDRFRNTMHLHVQKHHVLTGSQTLCIDRFRNIFVLIDSETLCIYMFRTTMYWQVHKKFALTARLRNTSDYALTGSQMTICIDKFRNTLHWQIGRFTNIVYNRGSQTLCLTGVQILLKKKKWCFNAICFFNWSY